MRKGAVEQRDEIDRIPPRVRLLHPFGAGELRRQRREHNTCTFPAGDIERFERLIHEIERVPAVEVAVIGRGREEHVSELLRRGTYLRCSDDRALRSLGVAHLDEVAEPACELRGVSRTGERVEPEMGRLSGGVGRDVGQSVMERCGTVRRVKLGQKVHQASERRQPSKPTSSTPGDAEVEPVAERLDARRVRLQDRKRRLREHERDVPLESVTQALSLVLDDVVQRAEVEEYVVAANLDREAAQVVGPLVEGPAG